MGAYSPVGDAQFVGDDFVGESGGDQAGDFDFPRTKGFCGERVAGGMEQEFVAAFGFGP
jgi:hypothetical protein